MIGLNDIARQKAAEAAWNPFWLHWKSLPTNAGYAHFSGTHLAALGVIAAILLVSVWTFRRVSDRAKQRWLKAIPLVMTGMEVIKDLLLYAQGRFSDQYLPLQLCSLGVFVFLLAEFLPGNRGRKVLGEIAMMLILPGAIAALLFPNWSPIYPLWNFFSLHSYTWHTLLIMYPLLLLETGVLDLSIRHIYYEILFLCAVVPPILLFDKRFHLNYMFVNWPVKDSPLEWMEQRMGNPGYLAGYVALTLAVLAVVYIPVEISRRRNGKKESK